MDTAQPETSPETAAQMDGDAPLKLRRESINRLQIGALGLGAMLLLVGLANVIMERARESQASAVPDAAATIAAPEATDAPQDPLADTGVVPEVAPSETPAPAAVGQGQPQGLLQGQPQGNPQGQQMSAEAAAGDAQ